MHLRQLVCKIIELTDFDYISKGTDRINASLKAWNSIQTYRLCEAAKVVRSSNRYSTQNRYSTEVGVVIFHRLIDPFPAILELRAQKLSTYKELLINYRIIS